MRFPKFVLPHYWGGPDMRAYSNKTDAPFPACIPVFPKKFPKPIIPPSQITTASQGDLAVNLPYLLQ